MKTHEFKFDFGDTAFMIERLTGNDRADCDVCGTKGHVISERDNKKYTCPRCHGSGTARDIDSILFNRAKIRIVGRNLDQVCNNGKLIRNVEKYRARSTPVDYELPRYLEIEEIFATEEEADAEIKRLAKEYKRKGGIIRG